MVEKNTGKRFVNELADRKTRADAMLAHTDKKGNPVYPIIVTDSNGASHASKLDKALETGVVKKFNSLQEVASHYGIPYSGLKKTIDKYNQAVAKGKKKDPEFGKPIPENQKKIEKAPFYALRGWPKVHHTMGGVQINTKAEVIRMNSDGIIEGLYAAGEAVGGPHGASRLGSCAITDCLVFGRIAGKSAAKNDSWG
jgi:succinate dehydrogenase/fumarate reductase flavoprotein subunit